MNSTAKDWIWMPHPGHFICAFDCRFRLNTYVNGYIVSTVGELFPNESGREIEARLRGIKLKGMGDERAADYFRKIGFENIGLGRKYETMVFKAKKSKEKCCPWRMVSGELDFEGYNNAGAAYKGHLKFCRKWSKK